MLLHNADEAVYNCPIEPGSWHLCITLPEGGSLMLLFARRDQTVLAHMEAGPCVTPVDQLVKL